MIYYVADIHFRDEKIFKKCNRPFSDIAEYEKEIIRRWNNKVTNEDTVNILGDLVRDDCMEELNIFKRLNGHKHLIIGNHDEMLFDKIRSSDLFESIAFIKVIMDNDKKVCLCHYPLMDWTEFNRGDYHVFGHVHNKTIANGKAYQQIKQYYQDKPTYNCGVDVIDYEPVTLEELIKAKEKNANEPYIY